MKRFANEKSGLGQKPTAEPYAKPQRPRANDEFGGFGTASGNGYASPMEAARFGHPGAIAMLQSGGGLGPRGASPVPGHLVVKAQRLLGIDLSDVVIEEDPTLAEQGKRGVAEEGRRIRLVPQAAGDMELIWHELVHIVQQRKASERTDAGAADGPDASERDGSKVSGAEGAEVSGAEPDAGSVDPEQEAKAGGAALSNDSAVQIVGEATGPMYSDEARDSVSSQPLESSSESGTICEPPNHSEGVESESAESHGEFQGNESGVVCASGESEEQAAPQESDVKTAVVEVVEIPKGLQAFFDAPSYEIGANGRVLGASPDAEGATRETPGQSRELTSAELNQAIAMLEGMSAGEREVFLNSTQQRNPASVLLQTELFMETLALREDADSDSYSDRAQALAERAQGQSQLVQWALTYPKVQLSESGSISVTRPKSTTPAG